MKPAPAAIGRPLGAVLLLVASASSMGAAGDPLAGKERRLDHDRAQIAYRLEWKGCRKLQANAKDICRVQARGQFEIAKAQIEARYKRSPANEDGVKLARGEAAYRLASEKCDDLQGSSKHVCKADARTTWVAARGEARLSRAAVDKGVKSKQAVNQRNKVREDTADALYAAARARCDTLAGDAKSACIGDAMRKYGKL